MLYLDVMAKVKGTIRTVTYYNPDNGFTVARLDTEKGTRQPSATEPLITIVGKLPPLSTGDHVEADGEWERHARYGQQLRVSSLSLAAPATREGITRFLGSGLIKGIGPTTARKLVAAWGTGALDVLDNEPERLQEIPGLGTRTAKRITESWQQQRSLRHLMLFLQEFGITLGLAQRIHEEMGAGAIADLKQNPFLLCTMGGIGFRRADAIAQRIGIQGDMLERVEAGVLFELNRSLSEGHAYLPCAELLKRVHELAQVDEARVYYCLTQILGQEKVMATRDPGGERFIPVWRVQSIHTPGETGHSQALPAGADAIPTPDTGGLEDEQLQMAIYLPWVYQCEAGLAANLRHLLHRHTSLAHRMAAYDWQGFWAKSSRDLSLTVRQQEAVQAALQSPFSVLTGGPGTGKTTTISTIIELCRHLGLEVLLAAPTGRAAKRMQETTDIPARTVHRLLEVSMARGNMEFERDDRNPLAGDLLIVDEVSMLDLHIAYHLSKAIPETMHVMLVGDVDQLPSVGVGRVLNDIIRVIDDGRRQDRKQPLPARVVRLDAIFRQGADSAIVMNAHRVRNGESPVLDNARFRDFFFMQEAEPEAVQATCLELLRSRLPNYFRIPTRDIMVLSPMRRGIIGVDNLNRALQEGLNPECPDMPVLRRGEMILREGDPVMQVRNDYDKMVFNGDLGTLTRVYPDKREARVTFDERTLTYTEQELDRLNLAYAVTIHKSQGSEYPAVIIPLMKTHYIMLQRNLLYTALTRARQLVVVIGQKEALWQAVRNARVAHRHSALYESLCRQLDGKCLTDPLFGSGAGF